MESCLQHHRILNENSKLEAAVAKIYSNPEYAILSDPDTMLYSGSFFSDADQQKMEEIHQMTPQQLGNHVSHFDDDRLDEMLFRFRARNYPDMLRKNEVREWREYCENRLTEPGTGIRTLAKLTQAITTERLRENITGQELALLDELEAYAKQLLPFVG